MKSRWAFFLHVSIGALIGIAIVRLFLFTIQDTITYQLLLSGATPNSKEPFAAFRTPTSIKLLLGLLTGGVIGYLVYGARAERKSRDD